MAWNKVLSAVVAPVTNQQLGQMAAEDPTSFLGQKVVALELQEPGLQFFSSAEQAAGTTTAVAQHLASPSAADQVAPFFAAVPFLMPAAAAYSYNQRDGSQALPQLQERMQNAAAEMRERATERAREQWATSLAGLETQLQTYGAELRARPLTFGAVSQAYSATREGMFLPRGFQTSKAWLGQRFPFLRPAMTLRRRPGVRILTLEDLQ